MQKKLYPIFLFLCLFASACSQQSGLTMRSDNKSKITETEEQKPSNTLLSNEIINNTKPSILTEVPEPVVPKSEPVVPKSEPVVPKPKVVVPKSEPVVPKPKVVVPKSKPVVPKPKVVVPKPKPVVPKSKPVVPKPKVVVPKPKVVVPKPKVVVPKPKVVVPKPVNPQPFLPQPIVPPIQNFSNPNVAFSDVDAQKQVLDATNVERAKVGCLPLVADAQLNSSADGHAEDMAANNYFAHNSLDGRTFDQRIDATGFRYAYAGENLGRGQTKVSNLMQDWMNSPGHRENIVQCKYTKLGVGYAFSNHNGISVHYWSQNFASEP